MISPKCGPSVLFEARVASLILGITPYYVHHCASKSSGLFQTIEHKGVLKSFEYSLPIHFPINIMQPTYAIEMV